MNRSINNITRSKTPTSKRLVTTTKNIKPERSVTPVKATKTTAKTSVSPLRKSTNKNTSGIKQEVLDLAKLERQLKQKLNQLKTDGDTLKEKYQRSMKDLDVKERKLEIDKNQIIDLFTNFVINKNINVEFSTKKKTRANASPIRSSKTTNDWTMKSFRDSSATKMKSIFMKNKKTPEIARQTFVNADSEYDTSDTQTKVHSSLCKELQCKRSAAISSNQRLLALDIDKYEF